MCGSMVKGSHIGMIGGTGRIGRSIMHRLRSFEPSKISYTSRTAQPSMEQEFNASFVTLDKLLAESDIIIVCCSLNDSTRRLLGAEQFRRMKSTAVLINTSRGACIDQQALYEALKNGIIAAAGLDVMETEPIPTDDPLLTLNNAGKFNILFTFRHHTKCLYLSVKFYVHLGGIIPYVKSYYQIDNSFIL